MKIRKDYLAYLFDMDGTLVNSEKLKGRSLAETCRHFGGTIEADSYKAVMGESWERVAMHFFTEAGINPGLEDFNRKFREIYLELLGSELEPNPNVVSLLTKLKTNGKKIGVVSSAFSWMVEKVLTHLDLTAFFDIVITKELVMNHKPDPEAYLVALEKLALPASGVLVFEDSYAGLLSAQKAGCDVVAFCHEFNTNHDLSQAVRIISDFNELEI